MNAVLLGGASMSIAAVAVRFVDDDDSDAEEAAYDE